MIKKPECVFIPNIDQVVSGRFLYKIVHEYNTSVPKLHPIAMWYHIEDGLLGIIRRFDFSIEIADGIEHAPIIEVDYATERWNPYSLESYVSMFARPPRAVLALKNFPPATIKSMLDTSSPPRYDGTIVGAYRREWLDIYSDLPNVGRSVIWKNNEYLLLNFACKPERLHLPNSFEKIETANFWV